MPHDKSTIKAIAECQLNELERALAILYTQDDPLNSMTPSEIAQLLEAGGHAKINRSRLGGRLEKDRRCSKHSGGYRIRANRRQEVGELCRDLLGPMRPILEVNWLDPELVEGAPRYVQEIVDQINTTYATKCFDACSVLVRRLVETLIVETFEKQEALSEITDANGDLVTLKHLIERAKQSQSFTLSRQTKNALPHLKDVGDWSAHNRRYLAKLSDLDRIQSHLRLAMADLGHLSGMN